MAKKAKQPTPRQIACRANGAKGGKARAKNLSAQELKAIASKAGKATHANHGDDYFIWLHKQRKYIGRYRTPVLESKRRKRRIQASIKEDLKQAKLDRRQ